MEKYIFPTVLAYIFQINKFATRVQRALLVAATAQMKINGVVGGTEKRIDSFKIHYMQNLVSDL